MTTTRRWLWTLRGAGRVMLLAVAAAGVGQAQTVAAPLADRDVERWARLLRAEDARLPDTAAVREALASGEPAVRRAALRTIGRNRLLTMASVLDSVVTARRADTAARADAAFSIGLLGAGATTCPAVLDSALGAPEGVAMAAAWALGERGAPCGRMLSEALRAVHGGRRRLPPLALAMLLESAAIVRTIDTAVVAAIAADRHRPERVRWSALWSLGRLRAPQGAAAALAQVRDPSPGIVEMALRLLTPTLLTDSAMREPARQAAAAALRHRHPHVRIAAIRTLAAHPPRPVEGDSALWARHRLERDRNVRTVLVEALVRTLAGDDPRIDTLWQADTTRAIRAIVIRRLEGTAPARAGALLAGEPVDAPAYSTARATLAAAAGTDSVAVLLAHPVARLRLAMLSRLGARDARERDTLRLRAAALTALQDADDGVREAAAELLATCGRPEDAAGLEDAYRRETAAPGGVDVQLSLLRAMAALRTRAGLPPDTALLRRLELPHDLRLLRLSPTLGPIGAASRAAVVSRFLDSTYRRLVREIAWPSARGRPPQLEWSTARGPIRVALDGELAPLTAWNLMVLARTGLYRDTRFHRVVPAFVAQDGDPRGDGSGGPGYAIPDELNRRWYRRGAVGMALSGPDTGGSQYFFTLAPQPHLDGRYTVFGTVVRGSAAMDALVQGDRLSDVRALR